MANKRDGLLRSGTVQLILYDDEGMETKEEEEEGDVDFDKDDTEQETTQQIDKLSERNRRRSSSWGKAKAILSIRWMLKASRYRKQTQVDRTGLSLLAEDGSNQVCHNIDATNESTASAIEQIEEISEKRALDVYTQEQIEHGRDLRAHPSVLGAINELWLIQELQASLDKDGLLAKGPYILLLIKFQYVIVPPPVRYAKALKNAEIDWRNDIKSGGPDCNRMTRAMFDDAMFQLAETWALEHDAASYVEVLTVLLNGISKLVGVNPGEHFDQAGIDVDLGAGKYHSANLQDIEEADTDIGTPRVTLDNFRPKSVQPSSFVPEQVEGGGNDTTGPTAAISGLPAKLEKERTFLKNGAIKHNPQFVLVAQTKFDGFRDILNDARKDVKMKGVSFANAVVAIGKLYQAKWLNDEKQRKNKSSLSRFDQFVFDQFVMQYGSKKIARRNLRRLFITVRQYALEGDPRMRMFAILVGLDIEPDKYDMGITKYDPYLASDYFLPTLTRVIEEGEQISSIIGHSSSHDASFYTLGITFQMVTLCVCKRTPLDSQVFKELVKELEHAQVNLTRDARRKSICSSQRAKVKVLRMGKKLSEALGKKGIENTLSHKLLVDLHMSLLMAIPCWVLDHKWSTMFKYVLSAKAATNWLRVAFKSSRKIPRFISILSAPNVVSGKISRADFYSVVTANAAIEAVETVSGESLRDIMQVTLQDINADDNRSEDEIAEAIINGLDNEQLQKISESTAIDAILGIPEDAKPIEMVAKESPEKVATKEGKNMKEPPEMGKAESSTPAPEPLFHPSPRTPRKILEEAKKRDSLINDPIQRPPS